MSCSGSDAGGLSARRLRQAEYLTVASIAAFVALLAGAALLTDSGQVLARLGSLEAAVIVGLLALSLVNYAARALRWQLFSRQLGIAVPPARGALYYVAGFAMTTTPGKLGEALRLWLIERCHGYEYRRLAPLLIGDRLSDMNAMLFLCLLGLLGFSGQLWTTLAAVAVLAPLSALFVRPRLLMIATAGLHRLLRRRHARAVAGLRRMLRLTARLFTARGFAVAMALSLAGWLAECSALYWLLHALGAPITWLQAVFVFAFAMVAGAVTMLPGGLGGVEATLFALLLSLGTDPQTAFAATAVIRLTTLWFAVGLGFLALPFALRLARRGGDEMRFATQGARQ